jgi:hypothetical protein
LATIDCSSIQENIIEQCLLVGCRAGTAALSGFSFPFSSCTLSLLFFAAFSGCKEEDMELRVGGCAPGKWGGGTVLQAPDSWMIVTPDNLNYFICLRA